MRMLLCQCAGLLAMTLSFAPFMWLAWFEPDKERAMGLVSLGSMILSGCMWGYAQYEVQAKKRGHNAIHSVLYTLFYSPCVLWWYAKRSINFKR